MLFVLEAVLTNITLITGMSTNYFDYIQPYAMNLHSINTNRPKPEFGPSSQSPPSNIGYTLNQSSEFENREKYMETQELTDEHCNHCTTNTNQNEQADDEQGPPPDLKRLVTGQTVSIDDSKPPAFDRVVPGEGNTSCSYSVPSSLNSVLSERFVSGSTTNNYPPVPVQMFSSNQKKEISSYNNENHFCDGNSANNPSQDFFDNYLASSKVAEDRSMLPQTRNIHARVNTSLLVENSPQEEPKFPANTFDLVNSKDMNNAFQNYQNRVPPISNKNEDVHCGSSFQQRMISSEDYEEKLTDQRRYEAGIRIRNPPFEGVGNYSTGIVDGIENQEKVSIDRRKYDQSLKIPSTNRMAIEGAPNNIPYTKPVPGTTSVQSPSYEHWYNRNSKTSSNEYSDSKPMRNHDVVRRDEKNQCWQNSQQVSMSQCLSGTTFHNQFETTLHSKTPSMSSNTSSANEISGYQPKEVDTTDRSVPRMFDNQVIANRLNDYEVKSTNKEIINLKMYSMEPVGDNFENRKEVGGRDDFINFENYAKKDVLSSFNVGQPVSQYFGLGVGRNMPTHDTSLRESRILRNNEEVENQQGPNGDKRQSRGTISGVQNSCNDDRQFPDISTNSSFGHTSLNLTNKKSEDDGNDHDPFTDSDEKSIDQRMVLGYNYNTIPRIEKNSPKLMGGSKSCKIEPPLETRMVVGETSSDTPNGITLVSANRNRKDGHFDPDKDRRVSKKRSECTRKKFLSGELKSEIDEEYNEVDKPLNVSPNRGSRYYGKTRYDSLRRSDKRLPRRDHGSSFTHDGSYNDDENDEYELSYYRDSRRYCDRRYVQNPRYGHHEYYDARYDRLSDPRREYMDRPTDCYYVRTTSRPSSRCGSDYRTDPLEYSSRYINTSRVPAYEYLDHRPLNLPKEQAKLLSGLREIDPKEYMMWFRNFLPEEYSRWYSLYVQQKSYQTDRRGSGHSGPSSINDDSISMNEEKLSSIKEMSISRPVDTEAASIQEHRSTPFKFPMSHVKGFFNAMGQLLVVKESSPREGQFAEVDLYKILPPANEPDAVQFLNFPGPFILGETHVNTVSEFVRKVEAESSTSSERLLYLLIDLVITLRGVTDGIAISELLMNSYRKSEKYKLITEKEELKPSCEMTNMGEEEIIEKYTNLLLQGNKNAALELAVNYKLWGHAFLLASKMADKYYSDVLTKFDSSIAINSPLKTIYQLYSNQIPQAATACGDEKWGDWRPHLAMILSNPVPDSEIDKSAIITLGDSLCGKDIFASHFCYLAAETVFEPHTKTSAKLSLLSLRNNVDDFGVGTPSRAILLTQAYEFAKRLQRKDFTISALMPYKYLLATRLMDYDRSKAALQYLESIATDYLKSPDEENRELMYNVLEVAERLKYSDSKPLVVDFSTNKYWLTSLRQFLAQDSFVCGAPPTSSSEIPFVAGEPSSHFQSQNYQQLPQMSVQQVQPPKSYQKGSAAMESTQQSHIFQPEQTFIQQSNSLPSTTEPSPPWDISSYPTAVLDSVSHGFNQCSGKNESSYEINSASQFNDYNASPISNYGDQQNYSIWSPPEATRQISMRPSSNSFYYKDSKSSAENEINNIRAEEVPKPNQSAPKESDSNSKEKKGENESGSWLSFLRLPLKKSSQAHLPDDKDPPLVYDSVKGRWVDKEKNNDDETNNILPPPKASELQGFQSNVDRGTPVENLTLMSSNSLVGIQNMSSTPPAPHNSICNLYKKQKGKGMKANYVNVLAQSSSTSSSSNMPPPSPTMDFYSTQTSSSLNSTVHSSGV